MANSGNSRTLSRGLVFWLLSGALFLTLLKNMNRRKKMTTINEGARKFYFDLLEEEFNYLTARYIFAQAAHETGNFTSDIFKNNNNLFGMKLPRVRNTTAIGERKGHAIYRSTIDSIKDFKIYFKASKLMQTFTSPGAYVKALKERKYFEADEKEYLNGVEYFYNLYFNES